MAEGKPNTGVHCLLVVVVIVVALLAIVAIIIGAISLGRKNGSSINYNSLPPPGQGSSTGSGRGSGSSGQNDNVIINRDGSTSDADRIWMIAVGHDNEAHEYIDVDGYIRGFQMDLILEVCEAAGAQCRTVWEPYSNCYASSAGKHSYGGKGLMSSWYDACCGWVQTVGRQEIFEFSEPFIVNEKSYFYVKRGNSFDTKDLSDVTIGFLDGWSSDEKCIARMKVKGTPIKVEQVKHYDTSDKLIDAINKGNVSAGFMPPSVVESSNLEEAGDGFACSQDGSSMMARKDNTFNQMWDRGFNIIKRNGKYRQVCNDAIAKHAIGRKLLDCYL